MLEDLPKDVREGLDAARLSRAKRRSRLRVRFGGQEFAILRLWDEGFSLDAAQALRMRGLVDVFDGARHLSHCLVIASDLDRGELICTYKRATTISDRPALDFERDETAPTALLPRR